MAVRTLRGSSGPRPWRAPRIADLPGAAGDLAVMDLLPSAARRLGSGAGAPMAVDRHRSDDAETALTAYEIPVAGEARPRCGPTFHETAPRAGGCKAEWPRDAAIGPD